MILNFDDYNFRCHAFGILMSEAKEKSPKEQIRALEQKKVDTINSLNEKIEAAEAKRDGIKNQETKGYATAKAKVEQLEQEKETKIIQINAEIKSLEPLTNEIFLSQTCQKYLIKCYVEAKYGRRDELENRYVKKGLGVEAEAISMLNEVDDVFPFYEKNERRIFDDFKQGECDIYHDGEVKKVLDVKSSWDLYTFIVKTLEKIDTDYWWQGQGYMDLWDVDFFELCYVLINTPKGIIEDEKKRLLYKLGSDKVDTQLYKDACAELEFNMTFDDIPIQERIVKLKVERNQEAIERLHERIKECRSWLNLYAKREFIRAYGLDEYKKLRPEEFEVAKVEPVIVDVPIPVNVPLEISLPSVGIELNVVDENDGDLAKTVAETATIINDAVKEGAVITAAPEPVIVDTPEPIVEPDLDVIFSSIEKITSIDDLDRYKEELEDAYSDNEDAFEKIYDALVARKNELKPVDVVLNVPVESITVNLSFEATNEPVEADPDYQNLRQRIDACEDKEAVIELRKEIKQYFDKYPDLSDIITQKRDSFNIVVEQPKAEVKQDKQIKLDIKPAQLAEEIKQESETVVNPDNEKIKKMYDDVKAMTKKEDIQQLYRDNKVLIDKNLPLRRYMESCIDKLKNIPNT